MFLDLFKSFLSFLLIGLVIKYMDDLNDGDAKLDYFPYFLMITSCAVLLDKNVAIASLWAAYAIGMTDKLKVHYILNLNGIFECVLVIVVGYVIFGFVDFTFYIVLMLFINLTDDLLDFNYDEFGKNLARKYGVVEIYLGAINLFLVLLYINYQYAFISIIAYSVIQLFYFYRGRVYDRKNNHSFYRC